MRKSTKLYNGPNDWYSPVLYEQCRLFSVVFCLMNAKNREKFAFIWLMLFYESNETIFFSSLTSESQHFGCFRRYLCVLVCWPHHSALLHLKTICSTQNHNRSRKFFVQFFSVVIRVHYLVAATAFDVESESFYFYFRTKNHNRLPEDYRCCATLFVCMLISHQFFRFHFVRPLFSLICTFEWNSDE